MALMLALPMMPWEAQAGSSQVKATMGHGVRACWNNKPTNAQPHPISSKEPPFIFLTWTLMGGVGGGQDLLSSGCFWASLHRWQICHFKFHLTRGGKGSINKNLSLNQII